MNEPRIKIASPANNRKIRIVLAVIYTIALLCMPFAVWPFISKYFIELDQRVEHTRQFWLECPKVQGLVTSTETIEEDDGYHRFTVTYTYQVVNTNYSGLQGWYLEHFQREYDEPYASGRPVTVYYDPSEPQNSVVTPMRINIMQVRTPGEWLASILAMPVLFVSCILIWTWAFRKQGKA